jgi:rhodanese-related sulfurtransferase
VLTGFLFVVCGLLTSLLGGCTSPWSQVSETQKMLVINVLDRALYDDCHIAGSIHVPFDHVEKYVQNMNKATEIVVYCSNYACTTSDYVARKLRDRGFTHVMVYEGGMAEWWQHKLPTVGPGLQPYLTKYMVKGEESDASSIPIISMHELAQKLNIDGANGVATAA